MKKTIVINLFAGPGAGKSTGAAYIFSQLKMKGVDAEYVTEFAKDKTWENNKEVLNCQLYISGKQTFKIQRCFGKVEVIVTDSPIALGAMYNDGTNPYLNDCLLYEFNRFNENGLNYFINRTKPYNPNGRNQSEDEAKQIDVDLKDWLYTHNVEFEEVKGEPEGYDIIIDQVMDKLTSIYK